MTVDEIEVYNAKYHKAVDLCEMLDIPTSLGSIYVETLYDILMDEEKLRVLVSKLRNKAFW
jgi:hypothetical protein